MKIPNSINSVTSGGDHHHDGKHTDVTANNLPFVGNPPTNNLRGSDSVGGVRFHFLSPADGTGAAAAGTPGGGASMNGPPTTAMGTPPSAGTASAATAAVLLAAVACCCSRAEEIVRGLHGASGGPEAVPTAGTRLSAMPCCGLEAILVERVSTGGCFTAMFSAAVAAVICYNNVNLAAIINIYDR